MATFTKTEITIIPAEEILECEVVNVEVKETPFLVDVKDPSKGYSEQVSFRFKVIGGEYDNQVIFGNTTTWYTDNSKLGSWVREILAMDELPTEFDTDVLVGARVNVIVGAKMKDVNGVPTVTGHKAETLSRILDDDYLTAAETF